MSRRTDDIATVEAAYDLQKDPAVWLGEVLRAAGSLHALGDLIVAFEYDTNGPIASWLQSVTSWGDGGESVSTMEGLFASASTNMLVDMYEWAGSVSAMPPAVLFSERFGQGPRYAEMKTVLQLMGAHDTALVNATDGSGRGVFACARQVTPHSAMHPGRRRRLARIASHLAAAARLRRATDEAPVAVLAGDGKPLHAEGLTTQAALPRLRDAVRRMDRARGPIRRSNPDEALDGWAALVEGRWSLLDSFESDGKRFVVARENAPAMPDPRGLTDSERAVAQLAAHGHSNKLIAYELGFAIGSVAAYLAAAMRKLGCATRMALINRLQLLNSARLDRMAFGREPLVVASEDAVTIHDARLSTAEQSILQAVLDGESQQSIATTRGTSARTVANQIAIAYRKLGLGSRRELVEWVGRQSLRP